MLPSNLIQMKIGAIQKPKHSNTTWQLPQVDLLNYFLSELVQSTTQVDLKANPVLLPKPKDIQKHLGLVGQYLYLQILVENSFHLQADIRTSNGPKSVLVTTNNTSQGDFCVVISPTISKWTLVVVDLQEISQKSFFSIDRLNVSGQSVLGAFYSGSLPYQLENMPSSINFKDVSFLEWHQQYDYLQVPAKIDPIKETQQAFPMTKPDSQRRPAQKTENKISTVSSHQVVSQGTSNLNLKLLQQKDFKQSHDRYSDKLVQEPIASIHDIKGFYVGGGIKWIGDSEVIYCSGEHTMVSFDLKDMKQKRFFVGHTQKINSFDVCTKYLASSQSNQLYLWDFYSTRILAKVSMHQVQSVVSISFNCDQTLVACLCKGKREQVVIWRMPASFDDTPLVAGSHVFDIDQVCLKFSPIQKDHLVSCGKQSIKVMQLRETGHIRCSSVVLAPLGRNLIFTELSYDQDHIYVNAHDGRVIQISYQGKVQKVIKSDETKDLDKAKVGREITSLISQNKIVTVKTNKIEGDALDDPIFVDSKINQAELSTSQDLLAVVTALNSLIVVDLRSGHQVIIKSREHQSAISHFDYQLGNIYSLSKSNLQVSSGANIMFDKDQNPTCLAASPTEEIVSCGFESCELYLLELKSEKFQKVATYSSAPVVAKYNYDGTQLAVGLLDGSTSLHNSQRHHTLIHNFIIEQSSGVVCVDFDKVGQIGMIGDKGTNVLVFGKNFVLASQVQVKEQVNCFCFSSRQPQMIIATAYSIKFYSYDTFQGSLLRQLEGCDKVTNLACTMNGAYFITGDSDGILRVWDYDADEASPYFYQMLVGHSSSPVCLIRGNRLISGSSADGVYEWSFHGDFATDYNPKVELEVRESDHHTATGLERIMRSVKLKLKSAKIKRVFVSLEQEFTIQNFTECKKIANLADQVTEEEVSNNKNIESRCDFTAAADAPIIQIDRITGYNGSEVLVVDHKAATIIYSLNNKIIREQIRSRTQEILVISGHEVTAIDRFEQSVAVGDSAGDIQVLALKGFKKSCNLSFHKTRIVSLRFTEANQLVSSDGSNLALWDIKEQYLMKNVNYQSSKIHFSPGRQSFFTIGLSLDYWSFAKQTEKLSRTEIKVPIAAHFTSISECEDLLFVGASNGTIVFYNMSTESVAYQQLFPLQCISQINTFRDSVLVSTKSQLVLFTRLGSELTIKTKMTFDSEIAFTLFQDCNEGYLSTSTGIYFVNLEVHNQTQIIKKVQNSKMVSLANTNLFLTVSNTETCLTDSRSLDTIANFHQFGIRGIVFVCEITDDLKLLGQPNGVVSLVSLSQLEIQTNFLLPLQNQENVTSGHYDISSNTISVGTSSGAIFFCNYSDDVMKATRIQVLTTRITSLVQQIGYIIASSCDGQVRTWKMEKGQFKLIDKVDLLDFVSPIQDLTDVERASLKISYLVSSAQRGDFCQNDKNQSTEALFYSQETYIAWTSCIPSLFLRNFTHQSTVRKIELNLLPTSFAHLNQKTCKEWLSVQKSHVYLVGTYGQVIALMIGSNGASKPVFTTAEGSITGSVISAEGTRDGIMVSSLGGEVINFCFE